MRRRDFVKSIGASAAAWPLAARAQKPTVPVIGYLGSESTDLSSRRLDAFRQGLAEAGYVEGKNVTIEYRWAQSRNDRLPALAADLVRRQVAVIATIGSTPAALAAKAATSTIPIVFQVGSDPVEVGLVTSLARPGGNVTGITNLNTELDSKRLELLHELVPAATTVGLLVNPTSPDLAETSTKNLQTATRKFGLQLQVLHASTERDFDTVFATLHRLEVRVLLIGPDAFFIGQSKQLGALTLRHAIAAITLYREFAAAGGLMSYGGSAKESDRQAGIYVGRVLKGERPADLPVQETTKVELVINVRTAKALGLDVPLSLLGRADEVIE
jgi:ABC-type uncharacterized transport system substrate-binding protein